MLGRTVWPVSPAKMLCTKAAASLPLTSKCTSSVVQLGPYVSHISWTAALPSIGSLPTYSTVKPPGPKASNAANTPPRLLAFHSRVYAVSSLYSLDTPLQTAQAGIARAGACAVVFFIFIQVGWRRAAMNLSYERHVTAFDSSENLGGRCKGNRTSTPSDAIFRT